MNAMYQGQKTEPRNTLTKVKDWTSAATGPYQRGLVKLIGYHRVHLTVRSRKITNMTQDHTKRVYMTTPAKKKSALIIFHGAKTLRIKSN